MLYGAMNFPIKPILDEIGEIAALGFDYLELAMDPPLAHYTIIKENKDSILEALNFHSLQLVCHLPTFVSTADLTESIRKASLNEVLKSLEVTAELGALKVVLHPGHIGGLGIFVMDMALNYALKSLEAIVAKADHLGLCLCLENMFPKLKSFCEPENFVETFTRFPDLKLALDTGHANIDSQDSRKILDFIGRFGPRIGHIHLSDNLGKRDDHLPIGAGTIDFFKIARSLKKAGYDGTVTLEIFSEDRRQLQSGREQFAAMLAAG